MDKIISGRVWKLPDDVDTDTIIPGRYGVLPTEEEMGRHCLEPLRPELAGQARSGDVFVAGKNFGCGSSREFAPACIRAIGIRCIIAKSFARIFFRNAINTGIYLIESDEIPEECSDGDKITVSVNSHVEVNGRRFAVRRMPDDLWAIIESGGLAEHYRRLNSQKETEGN